MTNLPLELTHPMTVKASSDGGWIVTGHPKYPNGLTGPGNGRATGYLARLLSGIYSVAEVDALLAYYRGLRVEPYPRFKTGCRIIGDVVYVGEKASAQTIRNRLALDFGHRRNLLYRHTQGDRT